MRWPELYEAKKQSAAIANEVERLLREHNALYKRELAAQHEWLLNQTEESVAAVEEAWDALRTSMDGHRAKLIAKAKFLQRHHSRLK